MVWRKTGASPATALAKRLLPALQSTSIMRNQPSAHSAASVLALASASAASAASSASPSTAVAPVALAGKPKLVSRASWCPGTSSATTAPPSATTTPSQMFRSPNSVPGPARGADRFATCQPNAWTARRLASRLAVQALGWQVANLSAPLAGPGTELGLRNICDGVVVAEGGAVVADDVPGHQDARDTSFGLPAKATGATAVDGDADDAADAADADASAKTEAAECALGWLRMMLVDCKAGSNRFASAVAGLAPVLRHTILQRLAVAAPSERARLSARAERVSKVLGAADVDDGSPFFASHCARHFLGDAGPWDGRVVGFEDVAELLCSRRSAGGADVQATADSRAIGPWTALGTTFDCERFVVRSRAEMAADSVSPEVAELPEAATLDAAKPAADVAESEDTCEVAGGDSAVEAADARRRQEAADARTAVIVDEAADAPASDVVPAAVAAALTAATVDEQRLRAAELLADLHPLQI
eukprot:NODE_1867_length_2350_cov_12.403959.p1 GENE.NODE_1867_length_2350_cov_12.403959~~NODE_1867_length_2350_cov_12.403959.p1  ORF type:complete len:477 (+),score=90.18 NODE_1867_length_2350_cov_12.403959:788-2218(+)